MKTRTKEIKAKKVNFSQRNVKFAFFVILLVLFTIFLARHIADIFFGNNSIEVYNTLKDRQLHLQNEIKRLQVDNARLQKEYFELKNLEPKE